MGRASSPGSVYTVSDSESEPYAPEGSSSPRKAGGKRVVKARSTIQTKGKDKAKAGVKRKADESDIEDVPIGLAVARPHSKEYHAVGAVAGLQEELLSWFEGVR